MLCYCRRNCKLDLSLRLSFKTGECPANARKTSILEYIATMPYSFLILVPLQLLCVMQHVPEADFWKHKAVPHLVFSLV